MFITLTLGSLSRSAGEGWGEGVGRVRDFVRSARRGTHTLTPALSRGREREFASPCIDAWSVRDAFGSGSQLCVVDIAPPTWKLPTYVYWFLERCERTRHARSCLPKTPARRCKCSP